MDPLLPINLKAWIEENRELLKPPVGNKQIWQNGEFIVMVVGGPNSRTDHHYNPTPEFFYQIEGEAVVNIKLEDGFKDIVIKEGEVFLLPSKVPHSPRRKAGTVGLVIEQRRPGLQDGLQWYCRNCGNLLYEEYFELKNIETQFQSIFARFFGSIDLRTCKKCGTIMPLPEGYPEGYKD
ncbi:MAG: 3-hydroxyanthranilate 3,4-dioxygenase [Bacteroidia bacterium]|nr:3-hydroxyanthranilate 3,4-dioxygenase [Bacteroidia bacterium]MDW8158796.1 3-hydroxyanthranilate 3,4-dioxygenase [Bacteroidia bacterium]